MERQRSVSVSCLLVGGPKKLGNWLGLFFGSLICRKCVCPASYNQTWQPCSSFFASPLRICRNSHNQEQVGWCLLRFLSWEQVSRPVRSEDEEEDEIGYI